MADTRRAAGARRGRHKARRRCWWAEGADADYVRYHDEEWGRPVRDDRRLFEMLTLEGAQAGLSWSTILRKRAGYRRAFANFDVRRVARFDARRRAARRRAGAYRAQRRAFAGSHRARLPFRRLDHHVRLPAGGRGRQRPHARLLSVPAAHAADGRCRAQAGGGPSSRITVAPAPERLLR